VTVVRGWRQWGLWLAPIAACLAVYYPGLQCWFRMDDFAWLGLWHEVHSWGDLARVLFEPRAQGTMRFLGERAYFLAFYHLFELDALPYRILVFATQFANLILVTMLARRMTGSLATAVWAGLVWGINCALSTPLSWTSVYNQVLCATFLLGALLLFIRFCDTGEMRHYLWQFLVFVVGFGALEINVVYPALAASWALCMARRRLLATLPLFAVSGAYTLLHNHVAPKQKEGIYGLHFGADMAARLWSYWFDGLGGGRLAEFHTARWSVKAAAAAPWILTALGIAFVAWRLWRRDWRALFPLLWFGAVIAPVLPLRDHYTHYYLAIPTIGLGLMAALAAAELATRPARAVALAAFLLYAATIAPVARGGAVFIRNRTWNVRVLVFGVEAAHKLHPDKMVLLSNVGSELFWEGISDRPFRLLGIDNLFLTPGSEDSIKAHPGYGDVNEHVLPPGQALRALDKGDAVVYTVAGGRMVNVTRSFHAMAHSRLKPGLARRIDVGHPTFADQLGEGWHPIESGFRWMDRRATVVLAGPTRPGERLHINGYCAAAVVARGPVHLTVKADGTAVGVFEVALPDQVFRFDGPLDAALLGRERIVVSLELDRALPVEGEPKELGLVFGGFAVR
jgi:hypothetical protein